MHELSICHALLAQVQQIAVQHAAQSVKTVHVRVGALSGVEPILLQQAYPQASANTVAARSTLEVEYVPVRVRCPSCCKESEVPMNRLDCLHCGQTQTQLIAGDELLLVSVDLEE